MLGQQDNKIEDHKLVLLLLLLQFLSVQLEQLLDCLETILAAHIREKRHLCRSIPPDKTRITWTAFFDKISELHFRRMFRMNLAAFNGLCKKITESIGKEVLRSEAHLLETGATRT